MVLSPKQRPKGERFCVCVCVCVCVCARARARARDPAGILSHHIAFTF
jgi:hypothetical protein